MPGVGILLGKWEDSAPVQRAGLDHKHLRGLPVPR